MKSSDVLVNSNRKQIYYSKRDINRDFPYLVEETKCMQTIGARVVNELYLKHLFSLALTLHGGTESMSYSYGAPNHLVGVPKVPMNYKVVNGKVEGTPTPETYGILKKYISGKMESRIKGRPKSTTPTDDIGIKCTY